MATDTPSEGMRQFVHAGWAAVAGAWGEHATYADSRGAAVTEQMLEVAALRPGDRVLELACGPGGAGLAAAPRVLPGGEVILSDVVEEMASIAGSRAAALGLSNVSTAVLDFEDIDQPDAAYDVVLCREGLMFAADPSWALVEIARVLRPDGRVAIAVWGPRARNPWLGMVLDAVSAQVGRPVPPPGVPSPFALDDPTLVADLLAGARLADVTVTEVDTPLEAAGFDEWWSRTLSLAGPLSAILAALDDAARGEIVERVRDGVVRYEVPGGLAFPGVSLVAGARKP